MLILFILGFNKHPEFAEFRYNGQPTVTTQLVWGQWLSVCAKTSRPGGFKGTESGALVKKFPSIDNLDSIPSVPTVGV